MPNFYKRLMKLSFRGNVPMISDMDEAFSDPYKKKKNNDGLGFDLNTPGDQSASGYGADYYTDRKPPPGASAIEDKAVKFPYGTDSDGADLELNDRTPQANDASSWYDSDSPLSRSSIVQRQLSGDNRDNNVTGPFNQPHVIGNFFDNIRRRIR